jgi:5'-3' exonuclease
VDKYAEANLKFMNEFIKLYSKDPDAAKAMYYSTKLKFDVNEPSGKELQKKMLHKYLEGLQWVLYYYYKGA